MVVGASNRLPEDDALGALFDRLTRRRKLDVALNHSLIHFKGLCEFDQEPGGILDDF